MASATTPKVRLVRCPKCRVVLPEVVDVPVYKCGRCNTILVAKNRNAITQSTSVLQETKADLPNKEFHVSEQGESSSSTPQVVLPSPPECQLSQESGGNQEISSDYHNEEHGEKLPIEGQHNDHYEKDQNTSSDSDSGCDKLYVKGSNEGQQNRSEQSQFDSLEDCNLQRSGISIESSSSTELDHKNEEPMLEAEASLEAEANDKTVQLEGEDSEVETNNKSDSTIRGFSIDNEPATREINSLVTAYEAAGEVISSHNIVSSPDEHLEQPQKSEHRGEAISSYNLVSSLDEHFEQPQNSEHRRFDRVRSTDTLETADFASPSSELSGPLEYLSKSTTVRSSHAYDGSISSYDGIDDHFPDQQVHSSTSKYNSANYLEERYRREKLPAKGMTNGNSGMQDYERNFSSDLADKKHYATAKYSKLRQDELLEPVMHQHRPRNWPRLERDEYSSQIPFSQRASLHGYEGAGSSRELRDEYPFDSAFHPLEKAEYAEDKNMKLLRMVYELQDQISKTCYLNGNSNARNSTDEPWRQKHFPTSYYQDLPGEENFYPRYHRRHGQRSRWSQQSRFSRIPFSGGAINTRYHIDNSFLCCHPQDWHPSEQLPPPIFRHNQRLHRVHPGHSCYNSYSSCPSSPQRYLESDFSIWSHGTKSDDQRYKDHDLKRYFREKHHSVRQHLRPMAGGAPFVICYHCFRPLQLPADFLLSNKSFHLLRCGACSKLLKFSLQKGIHIAPYELVAAEPPPSEVEDCGGVINVRTSTSASCSRGCLQADPMSYSDDYGNSFCKSCSTEEDPISHAQFHDRVMTRNMSSTSSKPMEQGKNYVSKQSQSKHKNSVETFDSAGPSSSVPGLDRVAARIEGLPPRTGGSPLHRLMGYSSPSQVLTGFRQSISDTSVHSGENSGLNS